MATRRAFLAAAAAAGLAGCAGGSPAGTRTATAAAAEGETVMPTDTPELDLREANVVEVAFDGAPGGDVRFEVTLFHDDDGEAGYADWWQVEAIEGERLGRRELLHAHSTAPFTRSTTVAVPAEVTCVVVRGHDQTHGYGGRAMLVNLDRGASKGVEQGPEPRTFTAADCPD